MYERSSQKVQRAFKHRKIIKRIKRNRILTHEIILFSEIKKDQKVGLRVRVRIWGEVSTQIHCKHELLLTRSYFNDSDQNILYSAPPSLDIYLKDIVIHMQNKIHANLLVILLIISKGWYQFKWSSVGGWLS